MALPAPPAEGQDPHIVNRPNRNYDRHRRRSLYPATSSDSENDPVPQPSSLNVNEDEAGDMVGVSISQAQTRMKARSTPAEEKNRILERNGGYFESIPEMVHSDGLYLSDITAEPQSEEREGKASENQKQKQEEPGDQGREVAFNGDSTRPSKDGGNRSSFTRSILGGIPRPRALSGDTIANVSLKKFLPDLGSLARRSSLSFRSSSPGPNINTRPRRMTVKPPPSFRLVPEQRIIDTPESMSPPLRPRRKSESHADGAEEPISELQPVGDSTAAKHSFTRRPSGLGASGAPPLLRRTSSDHSLYLRASSTASSLDHRPQFEHVHSQVNSRFKAIKDSLQDSGSRLLSMPSFNLQDIRSEWGIQAVLQRRFPAQGE